MIERQWGNRSPLESFVAELAQELMGVESEVACRADHRQDALTKRQPAHRLTGKARLAPDHIGAQGAFCGIVGERQAGMVEKRPQHRLIAQQRLALADSARLAITVQTRLQTRLKGRAQTLHPLAVVGLAQVLASSSVFYSDH